jgi:capsular exopolysaccharide synthesis family protein
LARDTANTLAEILIARKEQAALDGGPEALTGPFTVIEPAVTPTVPLGPPLALNLALGFAIGLAGGTGLALLLEALDGTVYSTEVLGRVLDLPVLAVIPHARRVREAVFESHTPQAESFRRLSFHLSQNGTQSNSQSLLVTSAEPQEGKSTVVANLAMALAARGRNVVVVDADVRRPRQHQLLGVTNGTGLSDVLVGKSELGEVVRDTGTPHLRVLTAGTELGQAATRLGSQAMAHIVKSLGDSHDFVLVDTPSYLSVADTAALTSVGIEDTLLVVARSRSRQEAVQAAYSQLMETEAKCVGVVLTGGAHPARYEHYRSGKPTGER